MAKYTFWYWLTRVVPDKIQRAVCELIQVINIVTSYSVTLGLKLNK